MCLLALLDLNRAYTCVTNIVIFTINTCCINCWQYREQKNAANSDGEDKIKHNVKKSVQYIDEVGTSLDISQGLAENDLFIDLFESFSSDNTDYKATVSDYTNDVMETDVYLKYNQEVFQDKFITDPLNSYVTVYNANDRSNNSNKSSWETMTAGDNLMTHGLHPKKQTDVFREYHTVNAASEYSLELANRSYQGSEKYVSDVSFNSTKIKIGKKMYLINHTDFLPSEYEECFKSEPLIPIYTPFALESDEHSTVETTNRVKTNISGIDENSGFECTETIKRNSYITDEDIKTSEININPVIFSSNIEPVHTLYLIKEPAMNKKHQRQRQLKCASFDGYKRIENVEIIRPVTENTFQQMAETKGLIAHNNERSFENKIGPIKTIKSDRATMASKYKKNKENAPFTNKNVQNKRLFKRNKCFINKHTFFNNNQERISINKRRLKKNSAFSRKVKYNKRRFIKNKNQQGFAISDAKIKNTSSCLKFSTVNKNELLYHTTDNTPKRTSEDLDTLPTLVFLPRLIEESDYITSENKVTTFCVIYERIYLKPPYSLQSFALKKQKHMPRGEILMGKITGILTKGSFHVHFKISNIPEF
ncbi:hypothetical protein CDIK_0681 [Cucumispora dikerogammari]|nr:hypothetical protein CDIK_0681 [Cucumispora dikerogammari]